MNEHTWKRDRLFNGENSGKTTDIPKLSIRTTGNDSPTVTIQKFDHLCTVDRVQHALNGVVRCKKLKRYFAVEKARRKGQKEFLLEKEKMLWDFGHLQVTIRQWEWGVYIGFAAREELKKVSFFIYYFPIWCWKPTFGVD